MNLIKWLALLQRKIKNLQKVPQTTLLKVERIRNNPLFKVCIVVQVNLFQKTEKSNSFLTRQSKLFKGGNYAMEEIIRGNTVHIYLT